VEGMILELEACPQTAAAMRPLKLEVTGWPQEATVPVVMVVANVSKAVSFLENLAAGHCGPASECEESTAAEVVTPSGPSSSTRNKTTHTISGLAAKAATLMNDASQSATRTAAAVKSAAVTAAMSWSVSQAPEAHITATVPQEPATQGASTAFLSTAPAPEPSPCIGSQGIIVADLSDLSGPSSSSSLMYSPTSVDLSQTMQIGTEYISALETQIRNQQQHIFTLQDQLHRPSTLQQQPEEHRSLHLSSGSSGDKQHVEIQVVAVQTTPLGTLNSFENSRSVTINHDELDVSRRLGSQALHAAIHHNTAASAQDSVTMNVAVVTDQFVLPQTSMRSPCYETAGDSGPSAIPRRSLDLANAHGYTQGSTLEALDATIVPDSPSVGECVEYFSSSAGTWISARVLSKTAKGTFNLDCKPDVLPDKIRRFIPRFGFTCRAGDVVEYYSTSHGGWVAAKVLAVHPNGNYDLDCKIDVPSSKLRNKNGLHRQLTY